MGVCEPMHLSLYGCDGGFLCPAMLGVDRTCYLSSCANHPQKYELFDEAGTNPTLLVFGSPPVRHLCTVRVLTTRPTLHGGYNRRVPPESGDGDESQTVADDGDLNRPKARGKGLGGEGASATLPPRRAKKDAARGTYKGTGHRKARRKRNAKRTVAELRSSKPDGAVAAALRVTTSTNPGMTTSNEYERVTTNDRSVDEFAKCPRPMMSPTPITRTRDLSHYCMPCPFL